MGISVIIVSYNVRHVLSACLNSIIHSAKNFNHKVEITVVDNNSRDDTLQLRDSFKQVTWIELPDNLGFGTASNIGVKQSGQPLILFLNPDTIIEENTLSVLWKFFESHGDMGVAGCKIKNPDNSLQLACRRSFPTPMVAFYRFSGLSRLFPGSRVFGKYNLTFLDENRECEVDAVSGSFMCVSREVFNSIKGFDEDFFMYGEDLDLCYRIKLTGKKNYYTPETTILHIKGESTKTRPIRSLFHFYRAMLIFSRKHLELRTVPLLVFYLGAGVLALFNFIYNRWKKWPRWCLDLISVNFILGAVTWGYSRVMTLPHVSESHLKLYLTWHLLLSALIFGFLGYSGDYGKYLLKMKNIYFVVSVPFLAFFTIGYFFYEEAYSRMVFGISGILSFIVLISWRYLASHNILTFTQFLVPLKRVIVVGEAGTAEQLKDLIVQGHLPGYEFIGMIEESEDNEKSSEFSDSIGNLPGMAKLLKKLEIHEIIIAKKDDSYNLAVKILSENWNENVPVKILTGELAPRSIMLIEVNFTERSDFKGK